MQGKIYILPQRLFTYKPIQQIILANYRKKIINEFNLAKKMQKRFTKIINKKMEKNTINTKKEKEMQKLKSEDSDESWEDVKKYI